MSTRSTMCAPPSARLTGWWPARYFPFFSCVFFSCLCPVCPLTLLSFSLCPFLVLSSSALPCTSPHTHARVSQRAYIVHTTLHQTPSSLHHALIIHTPRTHRIHARLYLAHNAYIRLGACTHITHNMQAHLSRKHARTYTTAYAHLHNTLLTYTTQALSPHARQLPSTSSLPVLNMTMTAEWKPFAHFDLFIRATGQCHPCSSSSSSSPSSSLFCFCFSSHVLSHAHAHTQVWSSLRGGRRATT